MGTKMLIELHGLNKDLMLVKLNHRISTKNMVD